MASNGQPSGQDATGASAGGADNPQDSVYAANRALFEASQAGQHIPGQQSGPGTPVFNLSGSAANIGKEESRPKSTSPGKATDTAGTDGPPARKKLIRAGDMPARNGSNEPGTPNQPSSAASQQESMREKIARAARAGSAGGAGSPALSAGNAFVAQPAYGHGANSNAELEGVVEANTRAFCAKNPNAPMDKVKQALYHSKGQFDANFQTALRLLMSTTANGQQASTPSAASPPPGASPLPGQQAAGQQPYQPARRYPGQNTAPQQSPPYPGSAAFNTMQQHQGSQTPQAQRASPTSQLHPHQMSAPAGSASAINGQSASTLPGAQYGNQTILQPPPPILPGTHPQIGFSALQILPAEQHGQFLALAPNQQTDYSMQVYHSLSPEQQTQYTVQAQAQQRMREAYNRQQQQNGGNGMIMIPPSGANSKALNPYIGYASQMPTQQQQQQQQRFPGQNPVFRVGAPQASQNQTQSQAPQPSPGQMQAQQAYLAEQHRIMVAQLNENERKQVLALTAEQQQAWVIQQLALRMEHQKRQVAQAQRQQQQQMMAKKHQEHKQKQHSGPSRPAAPAAAPSAPAAGKKRRRKNYSDDEDEELHLNDDSSGNEEDDDDEVDAGDVSEDEVEREARAIQWFNSTSVEELMEMTGAKPEIADAIIEMRPYESPGDIRHKLRKRKGVSGNLFDNYVDLMYSYAQTDECLARCTEIGKELEHVLSIWTGGKHVDVTESMRPSVEPEDVKASIKLENGEHKAEVKPASNSLEVPSAGPSRAGTPKLSAEQGANMGAALVEMSEAVIQQSKNQDASEEVKKAFEDYLYEQPKTLAEGVKLKNYQLLGVNWLNMLYRKKISCILADEMGLGKTIQVISFVAHLKEIGKPGPHLVIVPSSTLDNWIREFEKFAPSLKVYAYYGNQAERADARFFLKSEGDLDVLVTTYNMATGAPDDRKFLRKMEFKACVFDEGHQLKNAESKKYKDLMDIKVGWRLLLTGTPLQNNLQELVSLLSFILPKIFLEAQESLRAIFKVPPDAHKNLLTRQRVRAAKSVMTPFVLRRKKAQVLRDLPPKIELVEYCDMTQIQRDIYRETLAKHKKAVVEYAPSGTTTPADGDKPPPKKRGRQAAKTGKAVQENSTSNVLMALRKAANHPMLFRRLYDDKKIKQMAKECLKEEEFADRNVDYIYEDMDLMTDFELHRFVQPYKYLNKYGLKKDEWMDAGKVKKLMEMLPEIKARGDRVLIFSQFVSVLDILGQVLETMNLKYLTLTGQTNVNDRQGLVDEFTEDEEITCFLLSTRAGGLGLNLMAANVVIIMDMDFNPHNDKQAQDRAYRLGQTKEVTIYKFVTRGTIEEDMLALADTKLALDEQVSAESNVSGDLASKNLEMDEVQEGVVEKKVKASLMQTLQKRFEGGDVEYQQTQAAADAQDGKAPDVVVGEAEDDIPVQGE